MKKEMKKTGRALLCVVLAVALLASFAACGSNEAANTEAKNTQSDASTSTEALTAAPQADVILKVMISNDWNSDAMKDVFDSFQKTGIKLDVQVLPGGQQLNDVIGARASTNELPDIIYLYGASTFLKQVNASKNFADLSGEKYISKIVKSITAQKTWLKVDEKYYAIPAGGLNASGVIYNKKVFKDLNIDIPNTYDELMAACEKIKGKGITPFYEAGKDGWPLQIFSLNLFAGMIQKKQPDIFDKLNANQLKLAQVPEYIEMLDMQKALKTKGYLNKDIFSGTYDASLAGLADGSVAMIFNADWAIPTFVQKYPDVEFGMFAMPFDGDNVIALADPWAVGIAANSKNLAEAKKFLEFFTSDENLNTYYGKLKSIPCYSGLKLDLNPGTSEMAKLVEDGKALPMFNSLLNPSYKDYVKVCQEIYTDKASADLAKDVDDQRAELGKAMKLADWQ